MKTKIYISIIIILSLLSSWRLLRRGYPSMQDDTQIFRLQQFDQCINDGQIPCRFISNGGLGYGYPLYNYYPPSVYAVAELFHLTGFSLINSIKLVFILGHVIAGLAMFLLASHYWGNLGGLISATLFIFAPYRAIDGYVRGALAEFLAISLLPLIFYFLAKKKTTASILTITILLLTHNLVSLTIMPLIIIFILQNNQYRLKSLRFLVIPFLLAAFFLLPAIFEKNLVTLPTMTQGYFDYRAHFTTLKQLFWDRSWGYGASLWGPIDDMSFQVGLPLWIFGVLSIVFIKIQKTKIKQKTIILFALASIFSLFLTHNKSTFIWTRLPFMAYFQFPWRFLFLAIFGFSFISGSLFTSTTSKLLPLATVAIIIIANIGYFKEDIWFPNLTDQQKLNQAETIRQSGAGLKDYWPNFSNQFPNAFAPSSPQINSGQGTITNFTKKSNSAKAQINIDSPQAQIIFPMVYFPNWKVYLDDQLIDHSLTPDLGLIQISLPQGNHQLTLELKNTPLRNLANTISLLTISYFIFSPFVKLKTKKT